jgi:tol-pal system protein YbgF
MALVMQRASCLRGVLATSLLQVSFMVFLPQVQAQVVVASKQEVDQLDKRLDKLEGEMRAVQRKVFPGGNTRFFEPEIQQPAPEPVPPASQNASTSSNDAAARLLVRVTDLEKQLAQFTGRVETLENRQRILEEGFKKFQGDIEFRLTKLEEATAALVNPPAPQASLQIPSVSTPAANVPQTAPSVAKPGAANTPEAQYKAAFAFFETKDYVGAEQALSAWLARHEKHPLGSNALFWLGRTYMIQKDFGKAARSFLDGYNRFPKGERAPDSLLNLGEALLALNKPEDACATYNELQAVFPDLRTELRPRLAAARSKAKCR